MGILNDAKSDYKQVFRHAPLGDGNSGLEPFKDMADKRFKISFIETNEPQRWPDEIKLLSFM